MITGPAEQGPRQPVSTSDTRSCEPVLVDLLAQRPLDPLGARGDATGAHADADFLVVVLRPRLALGHGGVAELVEMLGACDASGHASPLLGAAVFGAILVENLGQSGGLDALVDVVVDHDDRRQPAGPEAASDVQREHPIAGGFAHFDAQRVLQAGEHFLAAADVAGRAQAHANQVLPARHRA